MSSSNKIALIETNLGAELMRVLHDQLVSLRTPWGITPKATQDEILEQMRQGIEEAVTGTVKRILGGGHPFVTVALKGIDAKEVTKCSIQLVSKSQADLHSLIDMVGNKLVLVLVPPDQYITGMDEIKSQADQTQLPLGDDE